MEIILQRHTHTQTLTRISNKEALPSGGLDSEPLPSVETKLVHHGLELRNDILFFVSPDGISLEHGNDHTKIEIEL